MTETAVLQTFLYSIYSTLDLYQDLVYHERRRIAFIIFVHPPTFSPQV